MYQSVIDVSDIASDQIKIFHDTMEEEDYIAIIKREQGTKCFIHQPFHISHIRLNGTTDDLIYVPTKIIPQKTTIQYIINSLKHDCMLLVEADDQNFIGYIDGFIFANYMYEQYKHQQAFLDTVVKTTNESFTVIDKKKRVIYWSKGAERLYSIKAEEIIGKKVTDFFEPDHLQILKSLHEGKSVHNMLHEPVKNYIVLINSNPVTVDNKNVGAVVFERDITHQVQLSEELYKTTKNLFNLEKKVNHRDPFKNIHGRSKKIKQTLKHVKRAALTDVNLFIKGENGLGKDLFAKAIHRLSDRQTAPFVHINCGAIPKSIFDSELFGYENVEQKEQNDSLNIGKVERANNGTLLLDHIHKMPLSTQEKLLRVIQEQKFFRKGSLEEVPVNIRFIATTNVNLEKLIEEGKFNEELYYHLNVINIVIPPLRERPEDIIELTHYFLHEYSVKYNQPIHGISQETMQTLLQHSWPGNIRELKNVIERLVVFSDNGQIKWQEIPFNEESHQLNGEAFGLMPLNSVQSNLPLKKQLERYEREIIIRKLAEVNGNKKECAQRLGITRATLYNRMNRLNIDL